MNPVSIPRLNDLLASPEAIACLAPDQIPAVLAELSAVQSALAARLLVAAAGGNGAGTSPEPDRMLSLDEASSILHQPINWIKRHKSLPFIRRPSRNSWLVSEKDLNKWIASRRKS
jgi:hypothetical protein